MSPRIRTLNFLPEIFQTSTNAQFLAASLDQIVDQPNIKKIEGYIGSKFGYGINAKDHYVTEPTKVRTNYQLDPGVVFTKTNESVAQDFISYPGILDAIKLEGGTVNNNDRLFESEIYSWDSFTDLDKIINFNQYYWLPNGPDQVTVTTETVFVENDYVVTDVVNGYNIVPISSTSGGSTNPTLTLIRGGTYTFAVNQDSQFWIQGAPGVTGYDPAQPNVQTREVLGVENNGAELGIVTFTVPSKTAQSQYNFPGNHLVDVVCSQPFDEVNGARVNSIGGIDGITSLEGATVMFYDPLNPNQVGYISKFFDSTNFDANDVSGPMTAAKTVTVTSTSAIGNYITCNTTSEMTTDSAITFTGTPFGNINTNLTSLPSPISSSSLVTGEKYSITFVGDTDWVAAGVTASAGATVSISGTTMTVSAESFGKLAVGQLITGAGIAAGTKIVSWDRNATILTGMQTYVVNTSQSVAGVSASGYDIVIGKSFVASGATAGTGMAMEYTPTIYYIKQIVNGTTFTISDEIGGNEVTLTTDTGSITGNINEGLYEEGYYTVTNQNYYTVTYVGDLSDPIISLIPAGSIPVNEKITAKYGTEWVSRKFYKTPAGAIQLIPFLSAELDTLYYQDGTTSNKVGIIKLIESNVSNTLNVETDILGKKTYTSTTGVVFTNGLKVVFQGDVFPQSYLSGEYYVEGVGTAIELVPATTLVAPETFTENTYIPWDIEAWDVSNWEGNSYIPVLHDYITIARNSLDKNPWSRSNRWFHIDVIKASALYNNEPSIVSKHATHANKAKRPIIEFYPNLKLFNAGVEGLPPVDFIDYRTVDAFSDVAGQRNYYPDVAAYTTETAVVTETNFTPTRTATASNGITGVFTVDSTTGFNSGDVVIFTTVPSFGGILINSLYYVKDVVSPTEFTISDTKGGDQFPITTATGSMGLTWFPQSTTITIPRLDVSGNVKIGQYITDLEDVLPRNSYVTEITETTALTLTIAWDEMNAGVYMPLQTVALVFTDTTVDNYGLFDGATVIFANDSNPAVRNKIFVAHTSTVDINQQPVITLTESSTGKVFNNQQAVVLRGYNYKGKNFYFDGSYWNPGQNKITVNQPPLFDVFDSNGISFGDVDVYVGSSFKGSKLFAYGIGTGTDDPVLGFPVRYSAVDNVGDISFDVSLNADSFDYVSGDSSITTKVNTGYVYKFSSRETNSRQIGWQTAVSPSIQYQIFEFNYEVASPVETFVCDIAPVSSTKTNWPVVQVFINNILQPKSNYTVATTVDSTSVTLNVPIIEDTIVQVLVYSDQISKVGYYGVPTNLNNNPLNADITVANVGDIRSQYQSIFYNNPDIDGAVFGANNYRDLGNMVPWGNKIIQNSASLVLPGAFMRKQNFNLFNALLFNSREYIKFKNLLIDVVNNSDYQSIMEPATMLDDALEQISSSKTDSQPFFWSDMIPSKAAYVSNTYSFANSLDLSIYPLTKVYDFTKANYNGVLVYLTRTTSGVTKTTQLLLNRDYEVSTTAPSLTLTLSLIPGDKITIKEYNQTYGSYIPNTPTKLGLYPASMPEVIKDEDYTVPTWFIKGHDGSYSKLFGTYDESTQTLVDFRDQVLLEFEKRIFNNLKINAIVPIRDYTVTPGFFRDSEYSLQEWLTMYSPNFLNWVGQNRLDFKRQVYNSNDSYTYNYSQSGNKLNKAPIDIGYWRGVYQYFFDTTTPHITPWEMLGFTTKPNWWDNRYGPAPYTSDNLVLWTDIENGVNWNDGDPKTINDLKRPGLLSVLPVNSNGELLSPFDSIVGNYAGNTLQKDWKVGDSGPVELSYRRSSSYPFDLMRLLALTKPAQFFNLAVDIDNYKFNNEFNQFLVNNRSHLRIGDIEIYGSGIAKTSYVNWIVDYNKQVGVDSSAEITTMLDNIDVRLIYRLAGFSDKHLMKFYVEKGTPNTKNASLLIPDDSYSVLLYDNQPFNKIVYSGVVVQIVNGGFSVYGNSQTNAYFKTLKPKYDGDYTNVSVENVNVKITNNFENVEVIVPYSTVFYSVQEVSQFLANYGAYLESQGMHFDHQEVELTINWNQMIAEFLYWAQSGWDEGSLTTLNPAAKFLKIDKESNVVQPLTYRQTNFILNQNLYPISNTDLGIVRDGTSFTVQSLNDGDTMAYGQFNVSNFEHGVVFDNVTLFNDIIYNLTTGLRQTRILLRGSKTAEWNGIVDAQGFIYNQNNVTEWKKEAKYTKGEIVKYKNKYWTSLAIIQPNNAFNEREWVQTEYEQIQTGLLPNPSTRSYESTLYYDINKANVENDADLLGFSLIGYRPRDYLSSVDLTDITQINVYRNILKTKGTKNAVNAFKGANFPQGNIDYDIYENWAIKTSEFGGVLNSNFVEFKLNQKYLTGNPSIVGLTSGIPIPGVQQNIPLYSLTNYNRPVTDTNILPTTNVTQTSLFPDAGYVNFNDVKMSSYYYSQIPSAVDQYGSSVTLDKFYVRDYVWIADYMGKWQVFTPSSIGAQVIKVQNNANGTLTVTFNGPHNLTQYQPLAIINFNELVDGYYLANLIVDQFSVMITSTLDPSVTTLNGSGVAFKFQSQRVASAADIEKLPLLDSEFIKNTVWVDTNNDGNWAVYRKSLNYRFASEFTKTSSINFGAAVATNDRLGYLISDPGLGVVYRYILNELTKVYTLDQVLTGDPSFGSTIVHSNDIYVVSQPTGTPAGSIFVYIHNNTKEDQTLSLLQTPIAAPANSINWGSALAISGDTNWLFISDVDNPVTPNLVYAYKKSQYSGEYEFANTLSVPGLAADDGFGYSITTDHYGEVIAIGAPFKDYDLTIDNWGKTYVFTRIVQNIEVQTNSIPLTAQKFPVVVTVPAITSLVTATTITTNLITCGSTTGFSVNDPVIFTGTAYTDSNIATDTVYFIHSVVSGTTFKIKSSKVATTPIALGTSSGSSLTAQVQPAENFVSVNGTLVDDSNFGFIDNTTLCYASELNAGDIITFGSSEFTLMQTLESTQAPRTSVKYGYAVGMTSTASELLVGAPFELLDNLSEGAVYRFTNAGNKYGVITGTSAVNVTASRHILLNGFDVIIPVGNATTAIAAINGAGVTNIHASEINGKIVISLLSTELAQANRKITLSAPDAIALTELGLSLFTATQLLTCPHQQSGTQFGSTIKFNESDTVVISAPVGTRYTATTFDFVDDEYQDNDTIFDNNATAWKDEYPNAGAAYMFDYVSQFEETLSNTGKFVYAQSVNALNETYGAQPKYATALDFCSNKVILGTPGFNPSVNNGQAVVFNNSVSTKNWEVYRKTAAVVDINRINNVQLFSNETFDTLTSLDYIDPLQGKLLGAVRENIDVISNTDPATYNNGLTIPNGLVWGSAHVGKIWFNTANVKFVNYHQNDAVYNSRYWGSVFPGSDVAVYTWISSNVPPASYAGTGTPFGVDSFTVQFSINSAGTLAPTYYYWVRNTNSIQASKTLSDSVITSYIQSPSSSGISYFAPLLPSTYALYNVDAYINSTDTVMHLGYASGENDDAAHNQYRLIRTDFASDFLPGVPSGTEAPQSLYDRMLDSLCGVDETGEVVPNPYLPAAMQTGILARPRQSFFVNRFNALKNYLTYANEILAQIPIAETRQSISFLTSSGDYYNTGSYWEFINWWAPGYSNNTKSALQVEKYADLSTLNTIPGTVVTVAKNGDGKFEVYQFNNENSWVRIGLENGTLRFKTSLWDYEAARLGFGDTFYDTTPYDSYPSEETRNVIRALNEQIYTQDLLIYRNKSLILLFEYIQSESSESRNYLPWLNKTSFIDVAHTIRELKPYSVFQTDNQEFLSGYLNEVKPYHVVIKEFLFKYAGSDTFAGSISDFDLPAKFDKSQEKFVSPKLVNANSNGIDEYLPSDAIWEEAEYSQWFANRGISLTGETNVLMTVTTSYIQLNATEFTVDNSHGLPTNGVFLLGNELIGYSQVDRALNVISGLTRGINGTSVTVHVPGTEVYMDLPPVLLLDSSRGYVEPPKVIAKIDTTRYPEPTRPAQLSAVMNLDSVLRIDVLDPGAGYEVLPEIVIDPSISVSINVTNVNVLVNTVSAYNTTLRTGDLIRYTVDETTDIPIGGLSNNQWYYINVLENDPLAVIALYSSYFDAKYDRDRIKLSSGGTGASHKFNLGAKASAISSAAPVRENNITLRFDRTTYDSQVIDWISGRFYGAFFAGEYNSRGLSSSGIQLESSQPPIRTMLSSSEGVTFQIEDVRNDRQTTYSSFVRNVSQTLASGNRIRLIPKDDGSNNPNASGTTIGFYVGMPIKFVGGTVGGLQSDIEYYVHTIYDSVDFAVSLSDGGPQVTLSNATVGVVDLRCYVGEVVDTAIVKVIYPGITKATNTFATSNKIKIPLTATGTGGTHNFYTNLPLFFTGDMIGGLVENQIYYVTTVFDAETFTLSERKDPKTVTILETKSSTDSLVATTNIDNFSINEPIVFNDMTVSGSPVTTFGNVQSNVIYYVVSKLNSSEIQISETINGTPITLTDETGTMVLTSQEDVVKLTTDSGNDMTANIGLPVSPGQVNGQRFTFYQTSEQYVGLTGTMGNLLTRNIASVNSSSNTVALTDASGGMTNIYVNLPVRVQSTIGSLMAGTTYYVLASGTVEIDVTAATSSGNLITCDDTSYMYIDMPITFSGLSFGGISLGVEYYVHSIANSTQFRIKTSVTTSSSMTLISESGTMSATGSTYVKLSSSEGGPEFNPGNSQQTATMTIGSPAVITVTTPPANGTRIKFYTTGSLPVGITEGVPYFVRNVSGTNFNVSLTATGTLINTSGVQTGTHTMVLASEYTIQQYTTDLPVFAISSALGGYNAVITDAGTGLSVDNTFAIPGTLLGGTSPLNDAIVTITSVNVTTGSAIGVATSGVAAGVTAQYYVKVISENELALYENELLTVPVTGINFSFTPIQTANVVSTTSGTNVITVDSTNGFNINDPVVFTGGVVGGLTLGETYYIYSLTPTSMVVSTMPADPLTIVTLTSTTSEFIVGKLGSLISLPTPFIFNQSVVKYNNRIYLCIISNNDPEFILGKWELLQPDDRRLNELDRIIGYYQPRVNMPGVDLTQLVEGITYPNGTYRGNAFAPANQFDTDTLLLDKPFYPSEMTINAVLFDGSKYLGVVDKGTVYSAVIESTDATTWNINRLANTILTPTDIIFANGKYIVTTRNTATPVYRSTDGEIWSVYGQSLNLRLNAVAANNTQYVAVGDKSIISSTNAIDWVTRLTLPTNTTNELNDVLYVSVPGLTGFVTVGKGQEIVQILGVGEAVDVNLVYTSTNGETWTRANSVTAKGFNAVASNNTILVAVGEDGVIYQSSNGNFWSGINETAILSVNDISNVINVASSAGLSINAPVRFTNSFNVVNDSTTYYIVAVLSPTQIQVSTTIGGLPITLTPINPTDTTYVYVYPRTATLADITYANTKFMAVGNNGLIRSSSDGLVWTTQTSSVTTNLKTIAFNSVDSCWIAGGESNTILVSYDNGVTWTSAALFSEDENVYNVQGDNFQTGYGPEELVPGVVTDRLLMTVSTRPGTNWPVSQYAHNGYNSISVELSPDNGTQTVYSFDKVVSTPVQVRVSVISGVTGLSTTLYEPSYTVNWINNTVTLDTPLAYSPIMNKLRIDVYEAGNGYQLVKANTKTDPIRLNSTTGFNEIETTANYSASLYNGSGAVRPGTEPIETTSTSTISATDSIVVADASQFVLNDSVTFHGEVLGGLVEDTIYYVKTISTVNNSITVSASFDMGSGSAGPVFSLTDDSGDMHVIIRVGPGTPWADPITFHNGVKLIHGTTGTVTRTKSTTNTITCNTTASLAPGMRITFSNTAFGSIVPLYEYNVLAIVDANEFTIEDPLNPSVAVTLTNATGGATYVTNDYAFGLSSNGITATLIFSKGTYNASSDYLVYSVYGETIPTQIGYSLPETQLFTGTGVATVFNLSNFAGANNPSNAIVEINGVRQTSSQYTIDGGLDTITFSVAPANGAKIAVTTFNDTTEQYLNTQYGITGLTVAKIVNIENVITLPLATKVVTSSTTGTNTLTVVSTADFVIGQTAIFKGTGFGGVLTDGTVYFVGTIPSATEFTIVDQNNVTIPLSTASGSMVVEIGGLPAVRVTTNSAHSLTENDIVLLGGIEGSIQLNNNQYYAKIIKDNQFDLYNEPYNPLFGASNSPVEIVSTYTGNGYAWYADNFIIIDQVATATSTDPVLGNRITVTSTSEIISGTPVIFTGSVFGGVTANQKYFVKTVYSSTEFSISSTWGGEELLLSAAAGTMNVTQWEQTNVDRLWVTINGYRVPSTALFMSANNRVNILSEVLPTDEVIITRMTPSATPNEEIFVLDVSKDGEQRVYRANTQTRTWLVNPLSSLDTTIYVNDVSRITDTNVQNEVAGSPVAGVFAFGLVGDKNSISQVTVYNNTKTAAINSANFEVGIVEQSPTLFITDGAWIDSGDSLTITVLLGHTIQIAGERIRFTTVNTGSNTITGLSRGVDGTAVNSYLPATTEVYGILSGNLLNPQEYDNTWNSYDLTTDGDPLQISSTYAATFLKGDVN